MASNRWRVDVTPRRRCHPIVSAMAAVGMVVAHAAFAFASDSIRIAPNLHQPRGLALSANGQTMVIIEARDQAILAGDPAKEEPWRVVVGGAGGGLPTPVAVGFLPGDVVAAICRDGDAWTLRTYRTRPESAADPAMPLQTVPLGTAAAEGHAVAIAVYHARGWLVVTGLPAPLPPVVRCAIAGVSLGPSSDRSCPLLPEGHRPVAVAINTAGDIFLVLRPDDGDDILAVYDTAGRELLRLATGLHRVAAIAVSRGDDRLWAVGTSGQDQTGLWRLDAAIQDRRQVVKPVFLHPLTSPTAIASASERAIIVIDEVPQPTVLRIRPRAVEASISGSTVP